MKSVKEAMRNKAAAKKLGSLSVELINPQTGIINRILKRDI